MQNINLSIPFNDYETILNDRSIALKKGYLSNSKWVEGKIDDGEIFMRSKFRLKGDLSDHWTADKRLSLKLKLIKAK